jgi:hypothetical protein
MRLKGTFVQRQGSTREKDKTKKPASMSLLKGCSLQLTKYCRMGRGEWAEDKNLQEIPCKVGQGRQGTAACKKSGLVTSTSLGHPGSGSASPSLQKKASPHFASWTPRAAGLAASQARPFHIASQPVPPSIQNLFSPLSLSQIDPSWAI